MEMKGETRPLVIQRSNARLSYRFFKRLADIVLSGIGLILLSWLFFSWLYALSCMMVVRFFIHKPGLEKVKRNFGCGNSVRW